MVKLGDEFDLDRIFCSEVFCLGKLVCFEFVQNLKWFEYFVYDVFGLEVYIGIFVIVKIKFYGVFCFISFN